MQLSVRNLSVERGHRRIIDRLSFDVPAGQGLVVRGPNGAGKTTLLRTIAGLMPRVEGAIVLDGHDEARDLAAECHYVGHLNAVKSNLTVSENLAFWGSYLGRAPAEGLRQALEAFDLEPLADIPVGYLSAGQKRRAALARLMIAERPLWLLDEPTVSLDARSVDLLAAVMARHVSRGGIVLAATHLPLGLPSASELVLGRSAEGAS